MVRKTFGTLIFILITSCIIFTLFNAYSVAVLPHEKTIGPQTTETVVGKGDIITTDKPTIVTLKGKCQFILINLVNNEINKADISIQNKDDVNNMYQIPNIKLNGKYEFQYAISNPLDHCSAELYSDNQTKITIDDSIYNDDSILLLCLFVGSISTIIVAFIINKIFFAEPPTRRDK